MTFNHDKFIRNCLNSLKSAPADIIVVDNCSADNTVNIIEGEFPDVILIKSQENIGYGAGVNLGVKNANNEYIVILNPDTRVEQGSIEKLVKPLAKYDNLVTIPKALFYDGSKINTCGNIEHFTGLTFTRCLGDPVDQFNKKELVGGLSGVCFALKKADYEKIGGFDDNIFLYMEDAELSWRISINNHKILYVPKSVIYHDYNLEVKPEKIYHLEKGRYYILKKYFTKKIFVAFLPSILISEILTTGYSVLNGKKGLKYKYKALMDIRKMEVQKIEYNSHDLFKNLSWQIPDKQLSYSPVDNFLRKLANACFYLNFFFITTLVNLRDSPKVKDLNRGK